MVFFHPTVFGEQPPALIGFPFVRVELGRLNTNPIFANFGRRERFLRRLESQHVLMGYHDEDRRVVPYIWLSRALEPAARGSIPLWC